MTPAALEGMRNLVATAAILACVGGCASRSSQRIGYGVGGTIAVVGVLTMVAAALDDCGGGSDGVGEAIGEGIGCGLGKAMGFSMGLGAGLTGGMIVGVAAYSDPPPDPVEAPLPPSVIARPEVAQSSTRVEITKVPGPPIPEPPTTDPQLVRLTKQASVMARRDQCQAVVAVAQRVASIDREYRAAGFVADAPIATCLAR